MVDLADRQLGAGVIAANDEFFAQRENLLVPEPAVFDPQAFGHKGKVMDGWETRRRRGADADHPFPADADHDWALIRLGAPGMVRGLVVDTAHFRGNYPQRVSVEAAAVEGAPSPEHLLSGAVPWEEIVPRTPVRGHAANGFTVRGERRYTHLRLNQHPDGGIARLRVYGKVVPAPEWLGLLGTFDLASVLHGGAVEDASDCFYSSPTSIIRPDRARKTDDGWENRRRVRETNDWVRFRLAGHGQIRAWRSTRPTSTRATPRAGPRSTAATPPPPTHTTMRPGSRSCPAPPFSRTPHTDFGSQRLPLPRICASMPSRMGASPGYGPMALSPPQVRPVCWSGTRP
ncbi:allantoicase [Streptomyces zagrosensis]|uniref:Allantoicase n=1 Tax=Streptomyces zagrosensis TaxID=1042984 RepID=A0A7W9Q7S4_9ACTN|nr:allantoicase [Streptomyces zagrosensis]